jgi:hypothetical protein
MIQGTHDVPVTSSARAERPPHPALRADLSPQAGRGEPAYISARKTIVRTFLNPDIG